MVNFLIVSIYLSLFGFKIYKGLSSEFDKKVSHSWTSSLHGKSLCKMKWNATICVIGKGELKIEPHLHNREAKL